MEGTEQSELELVYSLLVCRCAFDVSQRCSENDGGDRTSSFEPGLELVFGWFRLQSVRG